MKKLIPLILVLVVACSTATSTPLSVPEVLMPTETEEPLIPTEYPLVGESTPRYTFLLLGGDYRAHRKNTGWGNKTDVMLLASIYMGDPVEITVVQIPRNLYVPLDSFPDIWAFAVYGLEDFPGLHYYFQEVFDVQLQGIAHINMDNFVWFIDELGGIYYGATVHTGEETLEYLRDNKNNWDHGVYDYEDRQFEVLKALAERVKTQFRENAAVTTGLLIDSYGYLFDTNLSAWEQVHWLIELGWQVATSEYNITLVKLWEPALIYGETPLEVRGWLQNTDLKQWMADTLGG